MSGRPEEIDSPDPARKFVWLDGDLVLTPRSASQGEEESGEELA